MLEITYMEIPLINHRLFTNNRSTYTHWYPGTKGRAPILISDLTYTHLAAIVDQYQTEAAKLLTQIAGHPVRQDGLTVKSFLKLHVKAWSAIINRVEHIRFYQPAVYTDLFVNKNYKKRIRKAKEAEKKSNQGLQYPSFNDFIDKTIEIKTNFKHEIGLGRDTRVIMNKEKIILKLLNLKLQIDALTDFLKKEF